jgi:hypothetical protein
MQNTKVSALFFNNLVIFEAELTRDALATDARPCHKSSVQSRCCVFYDTSLF